MFEIISTKNAPLAVGPYSQAIRTQELIFISGQIPLIVNTQELDGTTIETQAERVFQNMNAILKECGLSFDDVVKTTCFLTDINDFGKFNEIYAKYFTKKPSRSCVEVNHLPKGAICEVEAIAMRNGK